MNAYARIELLLNAERFEDALRLVVPALASEPQEAGLWSHAARAHLGAEQWADALTCAGHVVALLPDEGLGHFYASFALNGQGRHQEALQAALEAVRLTPLQPAFHQQVAETATQVRGRKRLAWKAATRAVELAPNRSDSHAVMGLVALRLSRPRVAEQALQHALALDPGNHRAQHNLGIVRLREGKMGAAARHLQSSAVADPGSELSERAFHTLVMRCLQKLHWGLWATWMLMWIVRDAVPATPGPDYALLVIFVLGVAAVSAFTLWSLRGIGAALRGVLWQVLRRSATSAGWLVCVLIAAVFMVASTLLPNPELRSQCHLFAGVALLVGCVVSWLEVGLQRRRDGSREHGGREQRRR